MVTAKEFARSFLLSKAKPLGEITEPVEIPTVQQMQREVEWLAECAEEFAAYMLEELSQEELADFLTKRGKERRDGAEARMRGWSTSDSCSTSNSYGKPFFAF